MKYLLFFNLISQDSKLSYTNIFVLLALLKVLIYSIFFSLCMYDIALLALVFLNYSHKRFISDKTFNRINEDKNVDEKIKNLKETDLLTLQNQINKINERFRNIN